MSEQWSSGIIDALPVWERDKAALYSVIAGHKSPFKIILKTRDEPRRLAIWITHHAGIVGMENLIIFDNMSADPEVLRIYEQFCGRLLVIRYAGFQDMLHHRHLQVPLQKALAQSCAYSTLIDTDELLVLYDGARFLANEKIVDFVMLQHGTPVLPATWLDNLFGYDDRFLLVPPADAVRGGLKWGKPIVSTKLETPNIVLHNTQLQDLIEREKLVTNLFILHKKQVVPQERIRANLHKIKSLGVVPQDMPLEQLLALDVDSFTVGRSILSDIHTMIELEGKRPAVHGSFQIDSQGVPIWQAAEQERVFHEFLQTPQKYADWLFSPWRDV